MKFYWLTKKCFVPECTSAFVVGQECSKEFFSLPTDYETKVKWLNAIRMRDRSELKVCEEHFRQEDIIIDDNRKKRLKTSAVPTRKLPRFVCPMCLGWKKDYCNNNQENICSCVVMDPVIKEPPEKRARMSWSRKEKYALFGMVKTYGNMRITPKGHFIIDWERVTYKYREYGFFGNETELRGLWQAMKTRAKRAFQNQGLIEKLDKKIYRFLYGKKSVTTNIPEEERPKILLRISLNNENTANANNEIGKERSVPSLLDNSEAPPFASPIEDRIPIIVLDDDEDEADKSSGFDEMETDDNSDEEIYSEDEYWGVEDLEKKLGISIGKPGRLKPDQTEDFEDEIIIISDNES